MARPATVDPVQKFRFDVKIVSVSLNPASVVNAAVRGSLEVFGRVGFTNVDIPEQSTKTMQYRENTDNPAPRKIAGLASFNDITLTRGVVSGRPGNKTKDFYKWIARTNYFNPGLSIINELTGTSRNVLLPQSENYRRDIIIIARDRDGRAARRWYILNAFPVNYKGGDGLDASSEANLVETLTLTYELAFELPSLKDAALEFVSSILQSAVGGVTGDVAAIAGELELGD